MSNYLLESAQKVVEFRLNLALKLQVAGPRFLKLSDLVARAVSAV